MTGSTGRLGGRIARQLTAAGAELRLVVRSPDRAPSLPGADVVQAGYRDHDAVRRALTGLDVVLMVSASESEDRLDEHRTFVDAAVEAGVRHLVYTSFCGAAADSTFLLARDHHVTEEHIEGSGLTWTHLRDNLYADFMPMLAGDDGVLRGPAGDGSVSLVAQTDIAAAAAAVLLDPLAHEGRTYTLTGPEAVTLPEAADTLTRVLGRPFAFQHESLEEAHASRSGYGAPEWQVEAWISTYTAIASGELAAVTTDVQRLTGRPPTSLADCIKQSR